MLNPSCLLVPHGGTARFFDSPEETDDWLLTLQWRVSTPRYCSHLSGNPCHVAPCLPVLFIHLEPWDYSFFTFSSYEVPGSCLMPCLGAHALMALDLATIFLVPWCSFGGSTLHLSIVYNGILSWPPQESHSPQVWMVPQSFSEPTSIYLEDFLLP